MVYSSCDKYLAATRFYRDFCRKEEISQSSRGIGGLIAQLASIIGVSVWFSMISE